MANKQTDVSKLFREKFESFELDNSANIELAMNKKLQTAKFWKMVKWGILIIVLSSLSLYVILPNQEDKDFSQNHIEDNNVEITTQKETVSNKQITLVKEEIISEVKEQTITNKKGNNNPTFNDHRQTNEPINQDINESELFATHRDILKYLASKTNSLKYKKPKTVTIEKTDLKLQLKKITEKPKAPKEASSFPNKNLSNIAAYGEFQISPLMFYNIKSPSLPTSDTLTQSQINGSPQISYEIGIAIKLQKRNKPWFLQTGLNYQDFREKVDYSFRKEYIDHNLSFWDYDSIYEYHFDPPNIDTVLVGVDSSYMDHWVKTENKKTNINSYTYLNIPVSIGYHFRKENRALSFQVSTGISLSILLKNKGYLYNEYGQIINYNSVKAKPIISWNLLLNTTINYKFKNGNTLFLRPSFQYQIGETTIINQPQQRKHLVYGLNFGYRIKIF